MSNLKTLLLLILSFTLLNCCPTQVDIDRLRITNKNVHFFVDFMEQKDNGIVSYPKDYCVLAVEKHKAVIYSYAKTRPEARTSAMDIARLLIAVCMNGSYIDPNNYTLQESVPIAKIYKEGPEVVFLLNHGTKQYVVKGNPGSSLSRSMKEEYNLYNGMKRIKNQKTLIKNQVLQQLQGNQNIANVKIPSDHSSVDNFVTVCDPQTNGYTNWMVMEYGGRAFSDYISFIRQGANYLTPEMRIDIYLKSADLLMELESENIAYCDFKPHNIVVDLNHIDRSKLIDIGSINLKAETEECMSYTNVFAPPEIFLHIRTANMLEEQKRKFISPVENETNIPLLDKIIQGEQLEQQKFKGDKQNSRYKAASNNITNITKMKEAIKNGKAQDILPNHLEEVYYIFAPTHLKKYLNKPQVDNAVNFDVYTLGTTIFEAELKSNLDIGYNTKFNMPNGTKKAVISVWNDLRLAYVRKKEPADGSAFINKEYRDGLVKTFEHNDEVKKIARLFETKNPALYRLLIWIVDNVFVDDFTVRSTMAELKVEIMRFKDEYNSQVLASQMQNIQITKKTQKYVI